MSLLAYVLSAGVGLFAPPADPVLEWEAPSSCPDRETALRDIDALLGGEAPREAFSFSVRIDRDGETHRLKLITRSGDDEEERVIRAPRCDSVVDAAVLMIAITLDPIAATGSVRNSGWTRASQHDASPSPPEPAERSQRGPDGTQARPPDPTPAPALAPAKRPVEPIQPPPRHTRPPPPKIVYGIRPQFVADWGALPSLSPGIGLNLSLTRGLLRFELTGAYWDQRRASRSDLQKQGAWVDLGTAATRMCVAFGTEKVKFPTCAGIEMGAMRSLGIGIDLTTPRNAFWIGGVGGPTLVWAFIPRLALSIGLDISVPFRRVAVETEAGDRLHLPEPVSLRPLAGLEVRI